MVILVRPIDVTSHLYGLPNDITYVHPPQVACHPSLSAVQFMFIVTYRFVANNFSFIDPERVAVTGVSYGGYVAGLMLADRVKDFLACGVAVTPVVDWRFYGKSFFC